MATCDILLQILCKVEMHTTILQNRLAQDCYLWQRYWWEHCSVVFRCVTFFSELLNMLTVDQVYHLASPASPPHYMYNPIKTIKTNTIGTVNMLGKTSALKLAICTTVSRKNVGRVFFYSLKQLELIFEIFGTQYPENHSGLTHA